MPLTASPPWEDVADRFARDYPDLDQEDLRRRYESSRSLGIQRGVESQRDSEPAGQYLGRRAIPFASSIRSFSDTNEYRAAMERINQGLDQPQDVAHVANYERTQEIDRNRGVLGQVASGLAHVPGLIGEALVGGAIAGRAIPAASAGASLLSRAGLGVGRTVAQTAATPSFYLPQAAERAAQQGGEWYSPQNLGPTFGMGLAQTAILGSLSKVAKIPGVGIIPALSRIGARTAVGMGEQQIVDVLGGAVDNIIPEAYQFRTRYGLLGNMLRGEWGELGTHAAVQAATFAAFSALHPVLHGETRPWQLGQEPPGPQRPIGPQQPSEPNQLPGFMNPQVNPRPGRPPIGPMGQPLPRQPGGLPQPQGQMVQGQPGQGMPRGHVFGEPTRERLPWGLRPENASPEAKDLEKARMEEKNSLANVPERLLTGPSGEILDAYQRAVKELAAIGGVKKAAEKLLKIHDAILNIEDRNPESAKKSLSANKAISKMMLGKWTEAYAKLLIDTIRKPSTPLDPADAQRMLDQTNAELAAGRMTTGPISPKSPAQADPLAGFGERRIAPTETPPVANPAATQTESRPNVPPVAQEVRTVANQVVPDRPEPVRGEHFGQVNIQSHIQDAIDRTTGLHTSERQSLEAMLSGRSGQEAADLLDAHGHSLIKTKLKVSKTISDQTVRNYADAAWEKLKAENPALELPDGSQLRDHPTHSDYLASIHSDQARTLVDTANKSGERGAENADLTEAIDRDIDNLQALLKDAGTREETLIDKIKKEGKQNGISEQEIQRLIEGERETALRADAADISARQSSRRQEQTSTAGERAREAARRRAAVGLRAEPAEPAEPVRSKEPIPGEDGSADPAGEPGVVRKFIKDEGGFIDPEQILRFGVDTLVRISKIAKSLSEAVPRPAISNRGLGRRAEMKLPEISTEKLKENAKELGQRMLGWYESVNNEVNQLAGHSVPILTKLDRMSGEAGHRLAATAEWVRRTVPYMVDKVVGERSERADRLRNGAGFMETEVRYAKQANREHAAKLRASGKEEEAKAYEAKADAMTTFVGKEVRPDEIPLKNEADYQYWVKSEEGKRFTKEYDEGPAPILIENWKVYKDLAEGDLVESLNQRPGRPVNFMRINSQADVSDTTVFTGGMKKGDLANVKQNRLIYDQTATRAHDAYELDPSKWIPASIVRSTTAKNKVDFYRSMEKAGLAKEGPAKQNIVLENGDTTWELPNVRGNKSLYIGNKARGEVRQILNVNDPMNAGLITDVAKVLNKAMLTIPLQEGVSHGKNLFTSLFSIGVNPADMIKNGIGVFRKDPKMMKGLQDLAKIDAVKSPGFESGQLWGGKTDPTAWAAKLLDFIGDSARLTLKDAHERNVKWGRIANTETSLRDFVNQGAGNYNKATQHRFVLWLRELGIGPFATAATNFYMQGMRMVTLDPGVKATTWAHAAGMRAELLGKMVAVVGTVFAINKAMWGNLFGDDDTPIGAIKTGKTADGKTTYMDLTALTGLTRGMRASGLMAITEGTRQGSSAPRIVDRAMENIFDNLMHPMEGPIVGFAHTLATGRNAIGMRVAQDPPPSGSHAWENLKAAGIQANPMTSNLFGQSRIQQDMTWGQKALSLMGPYNPFRIRGDAVLAEMHGRLREVEDARKVFNADPDNIRKAFPQEGEYRILHQFNQAITELEQAIKGRARSPIGTRQAAPPDTERINKMRDKIRELAKRSAVVLERFRQR